MTGYRSRWITEDVAGLAETARRFFETEAVPKQAKWEAQRHIDRDFWHKAGALGLLCPSIPAEYGGGGGTLAHDLVICEEASRVLETGFGNGNAVHSSVVAHYVLSYGTEEQRRAWLPPMATGEVLGAVAMTEPGAGSDLQGISTVARRDGDSYVLNGAKTFISNGATCDLVLVVATTDPAQRGRGLSLFAVEADRPGFRRGRILDKIGQHSSDTSELFFDDVRVPASSLLGGVEGRGFEQLKEQLVQERLILSLSAVAVAEAALRETVRYTRERVVFGAPLFDLQNTRFVLAECATLVHAGRVFLDSCVERHLEGRLEPEIAAMAKWWLTDLQCQTVDRCLQFFGGYGYMSEFPIARMYRDARVQKIYGGANEVMKEIIARSL